MMVQIIDFCDPNDQPKREDYWIDKLQYIYIYIYIHTYVYIYICIYMGSHEDNFEYKINTKCFWNFNKLILLKLNYNCQSFHRSCMYEPYMTSFIGQIWAQILARHSLKKAMTVNITRASIKIVWTFINLAKVAEVKYWPTDILLPRIKLYFQTISHQILHILMSTNCIVLGCIIRVLLGLPSVRSGEVSVGNRRITQKHINHRKTVIKQYIFFAGLLGLYCLKPILPRYG